MEHLGTLQISLHSVDGLGNRSYLVTFVSADTDETPLGRRRCLGDLALVRTLEALVADADDRLRVLQQVHDEGSASTSEIILSEAQEATYGPGGRRQSSASKAMVGRLEVQAHPLGRHITEEVADFLGEAAGQSFCHSCLARLLGTEFETARKAVYALRVTGSVFVGTAQCAACCQFRVTVAAF